MTQQVKNLTSTHEDVGSIPDLAQWVKALVWLWLQPAAAAPFQPPNRGASICHTWSPKKEKKKTGSAAILLFTDSALKPTPWHLLAPFLPQGLFFHPSDLGTCWLSSAPQALLS